MATEKLAFEEKTTIFLQFNMCKLSHLFLFTDLTGIII